jgi:RNA polymerase sigma-32 factor
MEAVKRWEPTLGPRFGTYAAYWIRAFVLRFLLTNSRLIHVGNTRAGRKLFFRLEKERQRLLAAGFEPTPWSRARSRPTRARARAAPRRRTR